MRGLELVLTQRLLKAPALALVLPLVEAAGKPLEPRPGLQSVSQQEAAHNKKNVRALLSKKCCSKA